MSDHDTNSSYDKFLDIYKQGFDTIFPLKTKTIKRKYFKIYHWMTKALINTSVTKIKLLKTKLKYPTTFNILKYK